jgi:Ca2+-transporting ATPase
MLAAAEQQTWTGLSAVEAARRLQSEGPNELPSAERRTTFVIAWEVVREPMFLLLVVAGTLYLFLGDFREALVLLGSILVVMGITIYQQRRTERALEALRDLSSPRALVIRDGQRLRIPGREVVRDDLLLLAEGDRVPADAILHRASNLSVDESLLTGESVPVRKLASPSPDTAILAPPGGDDLPFVYSGTLVVQGQGIARVSATGAQTQMGHIGTALQQVESGETLLQREVRRVVWVLATVGLLLCVVVILAYGFLQQHWLEGLLGGITLAMALLPEEFPVVLTVFLALGAWRIAQQQVLTRRVPAIETLGAATVLCSDKTGTLTLNQMAVRALMVPGQRYDIPAAVPVTLPERFHPLLEYGILACQREPFDPMEQAMHRLGEQTLAQTEHLHADWNEVQSYPLSPALLALSHVWQSPEGTDYVIAAKGAPEAIANLCHVDAVGEQDIMEQARLLAQDGLRVLGVAQARFQQREPLPTEQHAFDFTFIGLLGLADPIRPTVPAAIEECREAGIQVIMITGDAPATAQAIGRQIGLETGADQITGPELEELPEATLQQRSKTTRIFARIVPQQKLRIVSALKANGEVVAMTGDGVNDAPALKAAHIGIAMGGRGTDVAREAADLVLLDDDFSSIVQAVRLGRRIFDNLRKAMAYLFAIHVPIAGLSLLPVLLNWPLVLMPVHIVLLELIIDPACSIVFEAEPEEPNVMQRPPRKPTERVFSRQLVGISLLQGFSVLVILLGLFTLARLRGESEAEIRTLTVLALVLSNLGLIFANRSWSRSLPATIRTPNKALWWITGSVLAALLLIVTVPFLRELFAFAPLTWSDWLLCLGGGLASVCWFEGLKLLRSWYRQQQPERLSSKSHG